MEPEQKPLRLRIVGGTRAEVESELNELLDDYSAIAWNFIAVCDRVEANVVLLHNSLVRQSVLTQAKFGRGV
jgi:hypothetical protein